MTILPILCLAALAPAVSLAVWFFELEDVK